MTALTRALVVAAGLTLAVTVSLEAQAGAAPAAFSPETGVASWYGEPFHGRKTASGEIFDMGAMTAAHKSLPFGSLVIVTRISDGRRVVVRVNDRGPFVAGRIIDVSRAAALHLGLDRSGTAKVELRPAPAGTPLGAYPATGSPRIGGPLPGGPLPGGPVTGAPAGGGRAGKTAAAGTALAPGSAAVRIQVGSYRSEANARAAVDSLASAGLKAAIERSGDFWRVALYALEADRAALEAALDAAGWKDRLATAVRG